MAKKPNRTSERPVFSKIALTILRASGWTPDRTIPTTAYSAAYGEEEMKLIPRAKEFLSRFGGLTIRYQTSTRQEDVLDFRADRTVVGTGQGAIAGYEEWAHTRPLCPIGSYQCGHCMLLMDVHGRVFGGTEWSLVFVGETGTEAIDRILTGAPVEEIAADIVDETQQGMKALESLEEQIDQCLALARSLSREGLEDVIRALREAHDAAASKLRK